MSREKALPPIQENRWLGMVANKDAYLRVGEVLLAENFYLSEGAWRPRPGLVRLPTFTGTGAIQGLIQWGTLSGTRITTAFRDGNMFEYNWTTNAWTKITLSGVGITMNATATLDACVSRGRLIVTDGVNRPWMLSIAAGGARTYTTLTNAPIARGCDVYYDKVFFFDIPGAEITFEWSDEGNPATGYAANSQSWEFAQTDQGPVRALAPLNNMVNVLKEDSTAAVYGAVEESFQTDAVREGVSETEGTIAPGSVVVAGGDVFFLGQKGPRRIVVGERMVPIDERSDETGVRVNRLRDLWDTVNRDAWDRSIGLYDSQRNHVWWFVPTGTGTALSRALVYHVNEDAWSTYTFAESIRAACQAEDDEGAEHLLLADATGKVYRVAFDNVWSDAGAPVARTLRSRFYGQSTPSIVKRLQEVRLKLDLLTDLTATVSYNKAGVIGGAKSFSKAGVTGEQRYRRGFDVTATSLGWELKQSVVNQAASVTSALTILSAIGTETSW